MSFTRTLVGRDFLCMNKGKAVAQLGLYCGSCSTVARKRGWLESTMIFSGPGPDRVVGDMASTGRRGPPSGGNSNGHSISGGG